jgi:ethanolamine ammonia-lyase small subunit
MILERIFLTRHDTWLEVRAVLARRLCIVRHGASMPTPSDWQ